MEIIDSVSFRLQRVTVEYAYVSVPLAPAVFRDREDGKARIDTTWLMQRAVELGTDPDVKWNAESLDLHLHPIQKAPEPGERNDLS